MDEHSKLLASYRAVVKDGPDVPVLHLVERVDGLDGVAEQLMEHEANPRALVQLVHGEVIGGPVNSAPELLVEESDGGQNDVGLR